MTMHRTLAGTRLAFAILLWQVSVPAVAQNELSYPPKSGANEISFDEGRGLLEVSVSAYPLGRLMRDIADATGIDLIIYDSSPSLEEQVTIHFDSLPLRQGLERVLNGRTSYTILSAVSDPQQTRVWILSKGDPRRVRTDNPSTTRNSARSVMRQGGSNNALSDEQLRTLEDMEMEQFLKEMQQEAGISTRATETNENNQGNENSRSSE